MAPTTSPPLTGPIPVSRRAALLATVRGGQLTPRVSFFQLGQMRAARRRGLPLAVVVHEVVLTFRNPDARQVRVGRPNALVAAVPDEAAHAGGAR